MEQQDFSALVFGLDAGVSVLVWASAVESVSLSLRLAFVQFSQAGTEARLSQSLLSRPSREQRWVPADQSDLLPNPVPDPTPRLNQNLRPLSSFSDFPGTAVSSCVCAPARARGDPDLPDSAWEKGMMRDRDRVRGRESEVAEPRVHR